MFATLAAAVLLAYSPVKAADAFRFRLEHDPATLDWTKASTDLETYALMNIMEGLVELDKDMQPRPALAEKWDVSADGRVYTFRIRAGVKWTDGAALRAPQFVYSWKRLLAPGSKNAYRTFLRDVESVEALDDLTLRVKLKRVVPYFPTLLSFWVTFPQREELVKKGESWYSPPALVTLGPYRLTKWERGHELVFERNDGYHGPAPKLARVEAVVEPSNDKARGLLEARKIDALLSVSTQDVLRYANDPSHAWSLKQFPYLATVFVGFNARAGGPGANATLRRAIGQALDRAEVPLAIKSGEIPADSLIPKGLAGYDPAAALRFSVEEARATLVRAGLKARALPRLRLIAQKGHSGEAAAYVAQTLRANLGLEIDVRELSPPEFHAERKAARFDMYVGEWGADYPDASSFMEVMLSESGNNYTGWKNRRYDELVRGAAGETRVLERLKTYSEAQRILLQEAAVLIPLYYPRLTALISTQLSNFEISPLNYLFFKWIE
jgi:oligopeptide transport system substrate-binding protein